MLYTFLKFLGWGILLAFIGGCVGWALRALKCRGEVAAARASTVDEDEVERMRHRLANLEQVVAERDRLRMQVADMRHADSPGVVGAGIAGVDADADADADLDGGVVTDTDAVFGSADDAPADTDTAEDNVADASADSADADSSVADDAAAADGDAAATDAADEAPSIVPDAAGGADDAAASTTVAGLADTSASDDSTDAGSDGAVDAASDAPAVELDMGAAAEAIGKKIKLDDLTVVEGIGPKIGELCNGIGIETWQQLADTEVSALQSMLDDAGSRFQVHKPGTWPRQAGLLAAGQWAEFKTLTDELDGGV